MLRIFKRDPVKVAHKLKCKIACLELEVKEFQRGISDRSYSYSGYYSEYVLMEKKQNLAVLKLKLSAIEG